ncbi:unnamed protein product [Enterobius vermicularis]|uniref:ShKT domain-containing protein n=1 Tax=Enterobius vermicularis TaxID=51028 RepID=A0A0N4VC74_ENTVE|nr:unnamed protein product [Enterobius vermicularis]
MKRQCRKKCGYCFTSQKFLYLLYYLTFLILECKGELSNCAKKIGLCDKFEYASLMSSHCRKHVHTVR